MARVLAWLTVITCLVVTGCGSAPPIRYYILAAEAEPSQAAGDSPVLGIGPITLPAYLERREIVRRSTPAQLDLGNFDHWGAPLEEGFARALAENLAALVPTDRTVLYPWLDAPVAVQIPVTVRRFEAVDDQVELEARWRLQDPDAPSGDAARVSRISEPLIGDDYPSVVATMNRALLAFSREVATAITGQ